MKRKLPLFICMLLLMAALPFTAAANGATINTPLDFTLDSADPGYPGLSGNGWSWAAGSKVLILSGINVDVNDDFAIGLPNGAKIVLAEGTDNNIANSYGRGIFCEGSLFISGGGSLSLNTSAMGFRVLEDLTVDISGNLDITVTGNDCKYCPMGLCIGNCGDGGGDLVVRNCNTFSITSLDHAIRCFGNVSISDCGEVALLSALDHGYVGIRSFDTVTISNCPKVSIAGDYNGIRSSGDVLIADCPDIAVRANRDTGGEEPGHGIYADSGSVTITDSHLTVYGANFGIATGPICVYYEEDSAIGGDIVINNSYVDASCDPEYGYCAIFAGDDLYFNSGEGEHSRILLNGCAIILPEEGRILDLNMSAHGCQSITGLPEIEEITDWEQAANRAIIGPLYTLAYDANGGSGSMSDDGAYASGDTVIVLPSSFTAPAGFVFTGWNTAADGSGTAYAPGANFVIDSNATLYAQYAEIADVVYTVTFDSQGGSKVDPVKAAGNSTITKPEAPVREDYIFGGWYKEKECKNAWDFASNVVTEDMTLYAKWTPKGDLPATTGESTALIPPLAVVFLIGGLTLHRRRKVYA